MRMSEIKWRRFRENAVKLGDSCFIGWLKPANYREWVVLCSLCVCLLTFVDYLKNVSSSDLAWIACPRALITIKLESRLLLSRDAPMRAGGGSRAQSMLL